MKKLQEIISFLKTLLIALILAGIVRSFWFEPFHIPSGSMKPGLLVGDYIIVTKYSYGYSRYSFPFGFNFFEGRIFEEEPKLGDVVVFRYPPDPSLNYIKRLIGLPGDKIQMRDGVLYINDKKVEKILDGDFLDEEIADLPISFKKYIENLPNGLKIETLDVQKDSAGDDTGIYTVPADHYFMMGDNRDNSQDSRFLSYVGFVPKENLVGKARFIFFSTRNPLWQILKLPYSIRYNRIFKKIN